MKVQVAVNPQAGKTTDAENSCVQACAMTLRSQWELSYGLLTLLSSSLYLHIVL